LNQQFLEARARHRRRRQLLDEIKLVLIGMWLGVWLVRIVEALR